MGNEISNWGHAKSSIVPFVASACAIVPVFRFYILKSEQQTGKVSPLLLSFSEGAKRGITAAPSTSLAVGLPLLMQRHIEPWFQKEEGKTTWRTLILSAAVVGSLATPILLVFEGYSLKQGLFASLRHISCPKQYLAFSIQEIGCVGGLSAAKLIDHEARKLLNIQENPLTTYASAFLSGSAGAVAGHFGNTCSTRIRTGLPVNFSSFKQLSLGMVPRAKALGWFSVIYHLICNTVDS